PATLYDDCQHTHTHTLTHSCSSLFLFALTSCCNNSRRFTRASAIALRCDAAFHPHPTRDTSTRQSHLADDTVSLSFLSSLLFSSLLFSSLLFSSLLFSSLSVHQREGVPPGRVRALPRHARC